jgi:aryl-alcohol dehydrogenase-like predicted oxidoreductase
MKEIRLGKSELLVSRIAFGTWELGGDWGKTDDDAATDAIRWAAESGVTFFDTAQGYGFGASERLLSRALQGRDRDSFVVATKGGLRPSGTGIERDSSPRWIRQGVEDSLKALSLDYIDLYQIHWPDPNTPFEDTAGALATLVADGKIRHVGVSNFDVEQIESFSAALTVETLQPPYHLFRRDIETAILPYTAAHDIGVLVYGPLAHGLLSGTLREDTQFAPGDWRAASADFRGDTYHRNLAVVAALERLAQGELGISLSQLAVAWTLANPAVQVAIIGTRNPVHVNEAVDAADMILEPAVLERIREVMRDARPVAGPAPEMMPEG